MRRSRLGFDTITAYADAYVAALSRVCLGCFMNQTAFQFLFMLIELRDFFGSPNRDPVVMHLACKQSKALPLACKYFLHFLGVPGQTQRQRLWQRNLQLGSLGCTCAGIKIILCCDTGCFVGLQDYLCCRITCVVGLLVLQVCRCFRSHGLGLLSYICWICVLFWWRRLSSSGASGSAGPDPVLLSCNQCFQDYFWSCSFATFNLVLNLRPAPAKHPGGYGALLGLRNSCAVNLP